MFSSAEIEELRIGLRALSVLARNAPLDLADFARLNDLPQPDAAEIVAVFESFGYVRLHVEQALLEVTPMALSLVAGADFAPNSKQPLH